MPPASLIAYGGSWTRVNAWRTNGQPSVRRVRVDETVDPRPQPDITTSASATFDCAGHSQKRRRMYDAKRVGRSEAEAHIHA